MFATWFRFCLLALPMALVGCGGSGISGKALADCIRGSGASAKYFSGEGLAADIFAEFADKRLRITLFRTIPGGMSGAARARDFYERDRSEATSADRSRFKVVENAEVVWSRVPTPGEQKALNECFEQS